MSRWAAYEERDGLPLGYVEAADRDSALAAALAAFGSKVPCPYVREIVDVPRDIPIDPSKIRRFAEEPPTPEKLTTEERFANLLDAPGKEEWRDGPRDDGSTDSDDILPKD